MPFPIKTTPIYNPLHLYMIAPDLYIYESRQKGHKNTIRPLGYKSKKKHRQAVQPINAGIFMLFELDLGKTNELLYRNSRPGIHTSLVISLYDYFNCLTIILIANFEILSN
jgi:hypothetical protein